MLRIAVRSGCPPPGATSVANMVPTHATLRSSSSQASQ